MSESIERTLGRLEAKVDTLLASDSAMNTRVVSLEKWRWGLAGAYSALVGLVAYLKSN